VAPVNRRGGLTEEKQETKKIDDIMFVGATRPAGEVDEDEATSNPTRILRKFLNMWWRGVFAATTTAPKVEPGVWGRKALAALNR
jgi:hypothetical protein